MDEDPSVYRIAPNHGLLTGGFPVAGVMVLILKFLDAFLEKRIGIVEVEGNAGAENVNKGKPLVLDPLLYEIRQMSDVATETAGDEGGPIHDR